MALVRLLLLTGCRKGELLTLRWSDYREGHLFLRDSKTGPRTVWLSEPARRILDSLERRSRWVFPARRGDRPRDLYWLDRVWFMLRAEAGLTGVRLHDLRHTYASHALRRGETVLAIGRLLGHANPETTLKYTHSADAAIARMRPREREYTVWDSRAPGLGVRVRPTGGKSYVLLQRSPGGIAARFARAGVGEGHR